MGKPSKTKLHIFLLFFKSTKQLFSPPLKNVGENKFEEEEKRNHP